MPTDLAVLLVQEGAVTADALERALERQRESGGALDTALLELGAVDEFTLVGALSRAANLPPAPPSAWEAADARARRVFPSRVAERHGLAPFALDGRELSLVATYPVDLGLLDEISFMLSLHLTAHVGPEWRVRSLIHRLYGGPLEPRLAALATGSGAPAADAPPAEAPPEAPDLAPSDAFDDADRAPEPPRPAPSLGGFARDDSEPLEPLAAALAQALEAEDFPWDDEPPPAAGPEPANSPDLAPETEEASEAARADVGPAEPGPATPEPGPAAAADEREHAPEPAPEPEEPEKRPLDRSAPPRWSLADARVNLADARSRDEVVLAALRYARDFFEFAAAFAVTRDAVAGHDALGGDDDARARCRSVAIYTSDPGIFRTVIDTRAPYLGPVTRDAAGNEAILSGLGRDSPRTVLVHPVQLRGRVVCVLYADNGEAPVSPRRLGDLLLLFSAVGAAFERVIKARKTRPRRRSAPAPEAAPAAAVASAPSATPELAPEREPEPGAAPPSEAAPAAPASPAPPRPAPALHEWHTMEPAAVLGDVEIEVDLGDGVPPLEPAPPGAPEEPWRASVPPPTEPDALVAALLDTAPGSPGRAAAIERLAAAPPAKVIPLLVERLPGPVESEEDAAPPRALGPIPAALAALGAPALPALVAALQDAETGRRRAAAVLLGALGDPAAFPALADRAFDADPRVAAAAAAALAAHRRHPAMRPVPEKLRRALLSGVASRATGAARALGALRDVEAVPLLVQVLESSDRIPAGAAADALARITLQRLGTDPRRWLAWWKTNRGRGRAEWLFSGLTSSDREVRVAACEELSHAAPPPVDYSADAPAGERESAARAWAGWWARSGRVL